MSGEREHNDNPILVRLFLGCLSNLIFIAVLVLIFLEWASDQVKAFFGF